MSVVCHIKSGKKKEAFHAFLKGKEIHIETQDPTTVGFAKNTMAGALASGHIAECLGEWQPRFPLRPLWIGCEVDLYLTPRIGVSIPAWMRQVDLLLEKFCRRVLELGYNAVLFGTYEVSFVASSESHSSQFAEICKILQKHGLKVILKPHVILSSNYGKSPLDPVYTGAVKEAFLELHSKKLAIDYIFWSACFQHSECLGHPTALDATQKDLMKAEVEMMESALQGKVPLVYYVPAYGKQQVESISSLCDEVQQGTVIAFSAVAGDPWADHLHSHPLWEFLRLSPDISGTPLLPIVNIGALRQGEGLWPTLTFDLIEHFFGRCHRHNFLGVVCLAGSVSRPGSLLDCNLWVAGQALWKERSSLLLAESWFRAYRPDLDFPSHIKTLRGIRELVLELSFIRSLTPDKQRDNEEYRVLAVSLSSRLKQWQIQFEKEEKKRISKGERPSFYDYFTYFARDARRMISHFLQRFNVTLLQRDEEDQQEGFWTQVGKGNNKPIFLEHPQSGPSGSRMEQIYAENHLG